MTTTHANFRNNLFATAAMFLCLNTVTPTLTNATPNPQEIGKFSAENRIPNELAKEILTITATYGSRSPQAHAARVALHGMKKGTIEKTLAAFNAALAHAGHGSTAGHGTGHPAPAAAAAPAASHHTTTVGATAGGPHAHMATATPHAGHTAPVAAAAATHTAHPKPAGGHGTVHPAPAAPATSATGHGGAAAAGTPAATHGGAPAAAPAAGHHTTTAGATAGGPHAHMATATPHAGHPAPVAAAAATPAHPKPAGGHGTGHPAPGTATPPPTSATGHGGAAAAAPSTHAAPPPPPPGPAPVLTSTTSAMPSLPAGLKAAIHGHKFHTTAATPPRPATPPTTPGAGHGGAAAAPSTHAAPPPPGPAPNLLRATTTPTASHAKPAGGHGTGHPAPAAAAAAPAAAAPAAAAPATPLTPHQLAMAQIRGGTFQLKPTRTPVKAKKQGPAVTPKSWKVKQAGRIMRQPDPYDHPLKTSQPPALSMDATRIKVNITKAKIIFAQYMDKINHRNLLQHFISKTHFPSVPDWEFLDTVIKALITEEDFHKSFKIPELLEKQKHRYHPDPKEITNFYNEDAISVAIYLVEQIPIPYVRQEIAESIRNSQLPPVVKEAFFHYAHHLLPEHHVPMPVQWEPMPKAAALQAMGQRVQNSPMLAAAARSHSRSSSVSSSGSWGISSDDEDD